MKKIGPISATFVVLAVILGSARGFMVINLNVPAELLYKLTAVILLWLAGCGFLLQHSNKNHDLVILKNLLKINLLLGFLNISIDYVLIGEIDLADLYLFLAPFAIFLFLRVPPLYLEIAAAIITIAISFSVIGHFNLSLESVVDFDKAFEYIDKLRPDLSTGVQGKGRTAEFYRASGYTGNPHDSANILGMLSLFCLFRFILDNKVVHFALFLVAAYALALTQSATNISIAIACSAIFYGYLLKKRGSWLICIVGCSTVLVISVLALLSDGAMSVFARRMGGGGDWEGMFNQIGSEEVFSALPYYWLGHAHSLGSQAVDTELAFLKLISQLGLIHAIVLFCIMLFPIFYYVKTRNPPFSAVPSLAIVLFGFMSLLHYGSVFRVTSVFLYFMFAAISIDLIVTAKSSYVESKLLPTDTLQERNELV